ncbi:MAG: PAS domain S-box protein [Proteobacteria bacterium]|nr:PAS domain S-box protein [Pseudomonadota bacterium]
MEYLAMSELSRLKQKISELEKSGAELRRVEKALRESEERYRSLIKQSSDGVYIFDPNSGKILEANNQFLKMLGYSEDEILHLSMYEIVALDRATIDINIQKVFQNREYLSGLRQYVSKNGSLIDVEISSTLISYGDSNVIMVNVRNVTGRLKTENELKKQADRLREQAELLDIAEDAIIVSDISGAIIFWNHGAVERYGWSKDEAFGKNIHELLKTEFPEPFDNIKMKLFEVGRWEGELTHKSMEGKRIIVESRWALRKDVNNNPVAIMEINNDITKYKQAEEALQKAKDGLEHRVGERTAELRGANERLVLELNRRKLIEEMLRKGAERYKNLFENSPIGIYRTNPDGRILMANPTLVRMLGYNSFNELASSPSKKADYEPTYLKKKIKKRLEKGERVRGFEAKWKRYDNTVIHVRENAKAIRAADGTILFYEGTVEDISEQKKAEEKIDSYQKQLRSLASDLSLAEERERRRIATILHDHIGQILAISKIKLGALLELAKTSTFSRHSKSLFSEHSEREEEAGAPAKRVVALLVEGATPLRGQAQAPFIDNLKEVREHIEQAIRYTRSLTFELSPPILYELGLEAALEWLTEQVHEQHGIQYEFENDNHPKPVSDEIRVFLFTAVRELLVNVAKHAGAQKVKVTVRRIGDTISIHVADDGVGFSVSRMNSYLDKNKGFGLFSIRERLSHLGGQMDIRSQRGRSARICLVAPLAPEIKKRGI